MTNIRNLLLNYPEGAELDCLLFENVTFGGIDYENGIYPIKIRYGKDKTLSLTKYGQYVDNENAKCVIFPKGKTTWDGFDTQPNPGDIVVSENGACFIYKGRDELYYHSYCALTGEGNGVLVTEPSDRLVSVKQRLRHANPTEERNLLYQMSKNGYKWFEDTRTLVNLSDRFKNGDIVVVSDIYTWVCYLKSFENGKVLVHGSVCLDDSIRHLNKTNEYLCDIIDITDIHIADKADKDILFKETMEMGCYWNGKEIVKASETTSKFNPENLKPFQKVLYRMRDNDTWLAGFYNINKFNKHFIIGGAIVSQCIPYEDNEHLLGTTNDCADFYKTW